MKQKIIASSLLIAFCQPLAAAPTLVPVPIQDSLCHLADPDLARQLANGFVFLDGKDLLSFLYSRMPENRWLSKIIGKEAEIAPPANSWSVTVFGKYRPEYDRTALSILSFRQILLNDYESLTGHLSGFLKPSEELFQELRTRILMPLAAEGFSGPFSSSFDELMMQIDQVKLAAMVTFMAIHDMGKIPGLASAIELITAEGDADHDRVLVRGIENNRQLIAPTVEYLGEMEPLIPQLIIEAMKPEINAGQAAQWEDNEAGLAGLIGMPLETLDFYFSHLYLDLLGVKAGNTENGVAVNQPFIITPVIKNFMLVHDVGRKVAEGMDLREAYLIIKGHHMKRLGLPTGGPHDMAAAKLATLSRTNSTEVANWIRERFLNHPKRDHLKPYLERSGLDRPAYFIEYGPEIFEKLLKLKLSEGQTTPDREQAYRATDEAIELFLMMYEKAEPHLQGKEAGKRYIIGAKEVSLYLDGSPNSPLSCPIDYAPVGDNLLRVVNTRG